jgi:hypothetical protein
MTENLYFICPSHRHQELDGLCGKF